MLSNRELKELQPAHALWKRYAPDLAPLFTAVARVLEQGGLLAFTAETHSGDGVLLRETLRYAHGADHVRRALSGASLDPVSLDSVSYRTERDAPVPGLVVVAVKRASTAPSAGASAQFR